MANSPLARKTSLTPAICHARAWLFEEASEHLSQSVTDDEVELGQVGYVRRQLDYLADRWHEKAVL